MGVQEYDSAARRPRALEELLDLRGSRALLQALAERNVKVRYKRSVFGVFWTLLSPTLILAAVRRPLGAALLTLPLTLALTALFVLGVSLVVATGALYFPDVAPAWTMLLPALMFTAPVIYPAAILPPWLQPFVRYNPMTLY